MELPQKITDPIVLGFDGYLDKIYSLIRVRHSPTDYELMNHMSEWADRIKAASNSSASIEVYLHHWHTISVRFC